MRLRKHIIVDKCGVCDIKLYRDTFGKQGIKKLRGHYHHITPKENMGDNNSNNIILLCIHCHRKLHAFYSKVALELAIEKNKWFFQRCLEQFKNNITLSHV